MQIHIHRASRVAAALALLLSAGAASGQSPAAAAALDRLKDLSGGEILLRSDLPSAYTMIRATGSEPLLRDDAAMAPELRAQRFLAQFGAAMGVTDPANQLSLQRISHDRAGNTHVHLDQVHAGMPVYGARSVVHMNAFGIYAINGSFVSDLGSLPATPAVATAVLTAQAVAAVAKDHPAARLAVETARLSVYRSGLLEGFQGRNYLAWEVVVRSAAGDVRERLFLDAMQGGVINRIDEIHTVMNREIYSPNQDVPPVLTEGALQAPQDPALVGDTPSNPLTRVPRSPLDNLYIFAGGTYAVYRNLFGREGYDDGNTPPHEQVQKSVYLINDACPNAYWNGDSTNYCPGFDADDIVSHEWSHGYTQHTHGLIYQYQSGALNESYSDIFGEIYDLVNGLEGQLGVNLAEDQYYENGGSRWVVGEDLSEGAALALLRDMWDPDSFGYVPGTTRPVYNGPSPGSVISSPNYYCGTGDGGGVHTNSGVPNHAFAMLVDGKTFNDVEIPAIGMTRAAHIYFQAMTHYQTPVTNFLQHADALEQSCADLIGVELDHVLGGKSPDVIDAATCAAVDAAMRSVEMRISPAEKCAYRPLLIPEDQTPAICSAGSETVAFREDWEAAAVPAGWEITENRVGDTSDGINWLLSDDLPAPHGGRAMFIENSLGGTCTPGGDISGSFQLDSPSITVPAGSAHLRFTHLMQSEFQWDGGNIKVSVNGGDFTLVPPAGFRFNSYNDRLKTGSDLPDPVGLLSDGNTNPMAGEQAFTGADQGESFSRWGTSIVDLESVGAGAGDSLRFRFEFGQDGCNGNLGWYVDEVVVGHCPATAAAAATGRGQQIDPVTPAGRGGATGFIGLLILLGAARRRRRV